MIATSYSGGGSRSIVGFGLRQKIVREWLAQYANDIPLLSCSLNYSPALSLIAFFLVKWFLLWWWRRYPRGTGSERFFGIYSTFLGSSVSGCLTLALCSAVLGGHSSLSFELSELLLLTCLLLPAHLPLVLIIKILFYSNAECYSAFYNNIRFFAIVGIEGKNSLDRIHW